MRMSSVALAAVSAVSVGASIWLYTTLVDERDQRAALELELRTLRASGMPEAEVAHAPGSMPGPMRGPPAAPTLNKVAGSRPGPEAVPDPMYGSQAKAYNEVRRRLFSDSPEFRKAFRDQQRVA